MPYNSVSRCTLSTRKRLIRKPDRNKLYTLRREKKAAQVHYHNWQLAPSPTLLVTVFMEDLQAPEPPLGQVKGHEANPDSDGSLNPVHAETFVQALNDTLLCHYLPGSA